MKKYLIFGSIATVLGLVFALWLYPNASYIITEREYLEDESGAISYQSKSLIEEMGFADSIVYGTVIEELDSEKLVEKDDKDGITEIYRSPSKIKIKEVLGGEIKYDSITFLQHGARKDNPSIEYLKKGEDVVLFLSPQTNDGKYWSYQFEDGIWRVKQGKLYSKTKNPVYKKLKKANLNVFKNEIMGAKQESTPVD